MAGILDSILSYLPGGILNQPPPPAPLDANAYIAQNFPAASPNDRVASEFGALAPAMPLPRSRPAAADQAPPIAVGDYQMPRVGTANLFQPGPTDQAALPPNATPTTGQAPSSAEPQQPAVPETSLLGRIGKAIGGGLQSVDSAVAPHTATLLALAGGLAGAPSWGTGISRGLTGAAAALPVDQKLAMQQGGVQQTYKALVASGVPPQLALASVYNPEILKSTVQSYIADRKGEVKTIKDASGNERLVLVNPYDTSQPVKDLTPKGAGSSAFLAPGVAEEDKGLVGDAYMAQYSPELQSMAKAYINGDIMPTGNPRQQGLQTKAKEIAVKWGMDTGTPVSDSTYAEKRKVRVDLGSSGNSSLGGILSNGESSFKHLAEAGESMADLGNTSHNFLLGGPLAHAQNYATNVLTPSSETQGKVKALNNNLGRYGQESTKFYAGTGGGVEERTAARKEMNADTTSGEEYAAFLEKEKGLMLDRLNGKLDQIRQTLGGEEAAREIAKKMPEIEKSMARIDANIARLRGAAPPAAPADAASTPRLQPGQSTTINNVTIRRIN